MELITQEAEYSMSQNKSGCLSQDPCSLRYSKSLSNVNYIFQWLSYPILYCVAGSQILFLNSFSASCFKNPAVNFML